MRLFLCLLGLLLVALAPGFVAAGEAKNLFVAEVELRGADEASRNAAFRDGLKTVLRRLVRRESLGEPGVRALLTEAPRYVRQFEPVPGAPGDAGPARLRVTFTGAALLQALEARDVPAWGAERPEVLVWLVSEEAGQRHWAADVSPDVKVLLEQAAAERGLPLRLPGLDPPDRQSLTPDAVVAGQEEPLRAASGRYGSPAILAGYLLRKGENLWETAWRLYHAEDVRVWNEKAATLHEALNAGFGGAYDALALNDGPPAADEEGSAVEVEIAEVRGPTDLRRVRRILQALEGARNIELLRVAPDAATFRLEMPGGADALARQVGVKGELAPTEGGAYRLIP